MIKIIGFRDVSFQKDGDLIEGVSLYFTETPNVDEDVKGLHGCMCDKCFLSKNVYQRLLIQAKKDTLLNLEIPRFSYNKYGKVDGIIL